ncbi:swarming motility protein [Escherichia coli]|uniref:N-glycosidase YbiA n=1 Tax=Escherichia coli TaxID=562 RepID=A0A376TI55_ECOLX|nr:swarming motility protein [Escherichia coli]
MVAARMGRDRSKPLRKNWESVKEQVMRKALRAKFEQHPELRALLLATAPANWLSIRKTMLTGETVVMVRARIDWLPFNGVARTIGYREVTSRWLMGGKTDKFFPVFSNC